MLLKYLSKIASAALLGITILAAPSHAAGTTPLALVPQLDNNGNVAAACQLFFYQAGTVATKQNAYSDFGLTLPLANPLPCDQAGRVPMHWLADGLIHIRLTTSAGVQIVDTTMQVLGPSGGGGGGGTTVDPTTLMATGDIKARYGTGPLSGFVRANGMTLGNATSGASERANADTQNLFVYLCQTDANLVVSGGRSGNCLNDYNASKTIALPDWRGRALAFLDDMGNSAAGRLTAGYFGTSATTLGASGGAQSQTLVTINLPPYTPVGTVTTTTTGTFPVQGFAQTGSQVNTAASLGSNNGGLGALPITATSSSTFTGSAQGGTSTPFSMVPPMMLATIYIKL